MSSNLCVGTKRCNHCSSEKPVDQFNRRGENHYQGRCRSCQAKVFAEYHQENRAKHLTRIASRNKLVRSSRRAMVESLKSGKTCADCGGLFPTICLDFDHLPGKVKKFQIGNWSGRQELSLEDLSEEVNKCELVCSNCHRIRTHLRNQY